MRWKQTRRVVRIIARNTLRLRPHPWEHPDRSITGQRFTLAVCSMFKNEADYLAEWLDFHLAVGVEHFFLYDNGSTDGSLGVLAPYIRAGQVSVHTFKPRNVQTVAFDACCRTYEQQVQWLAVLDIDEFLYSTEVDDLRLALPEYADHPAVAVHWVMFSTSGHILRPEGGTLQNFTSCQTEGNKHVRLIVQPSRTVRFHNPHRADYTDGYAVDEHGQPRDDTNPAPPTVARLRVNHYWTRSVEEWFTRKLARGDVNSVTHLRDIEGVLLAERLYANGEDKEIQRLIPTF